MKPTTPAQYGHDLLTTILPSTGYTVLAFRWNGINGFADKFTSRCFDLSDNRTESLIDLQFTALTKWAESAAQHNGETEVQLYFATATQCAPISGRKLGPTKSAAAVSSLGLDIDLNTKGAKYPPPLVALDVLQDILSPSILISSGGGIHAYWLLDREYDLTKRIERDQYADLLDQLESTVQDELYWRRYQMDPGQGRVSRLLRLPGSWNIGAHTTVDYIGGTHRRHSTRRLKSRIRRVTRARQSTPYQCYVTQNGGEVGKIGNIDSSNTVVTGSPGVVPNDVDLFQTRLEECYVPNVLISSDEPLQNVTNGSEVFY